jgi:hypothetical protein
MPIKHSASADIPYGTGSIQQRGNVWWMIYRDVDGTTIQENARTTDRAEARRLLAKRALVNLQARVRALKAIIKEQPIKVTMRPAENPLPKERLGEIAERLLQILAEEEASEKLREGKADETPEASGAGTGGSAAANPRKKQHDGNAQHGRRNRSAHAHSAGGEGTGAKR